MNNAFRAFPFVCALVLAACSSSSTSSTPNVNTSGTTTYNFLKSVQLLSSGTFPASGGFDISFTDSSNYYLADRSNKGVDVVSLSTGKLVQTAGGGQFTGINASNSNLDGPNGIFTIGNNLVMAGDGNSTMKVVNVSSGSLIFTSSTLTEPAGAAPSGWTCTEGTPQRTDEGAFDSTDNIAVLVNDADCPPFMTFFSTAGGSYTQLGQIAFTTANGGAEQTTWDPTTDLFYISLPTTVANPGGELDVINPTTRTITAKYAEPANCQGNGTALGPNEELFIGCSNTAAGGSLVIMNPTTGATVATIAGADGCDEVWYNAKDNRFYGACSNNNNKTNPVLAVVNAASPYNLIALISTGAGAHSVAVDPGTNNAYVPIPTTNGAYVYSHP